MVYLRWYAMFLVTLGGSLFLLLNYSPFLPNFFRNLPNHLLWHLNHFIIILLFHLPLPLSLPTIHFQFPSIIHKLNKILENIYWFFNPPCLQCRWRIII